MKVRMFGTACCMIKAGDAELKRRGAGYYLVDQKFSSSFSDRLADVDRCRELLSRQKDMYSSSIQLWYGICLDHLHRAESGAENTVM